jgi:hypothetical protein
LGRGARWPDLSVGVGEIVHPFAPLVRVPTVAAALVVGPDGTGDLGAVLTHADLVALEKDDILNILHLCIYAYTLLVFC